VTDRQTDRITTPRTALAWRRAVKTPSVVILHKSVAVAEIGECDRLTTIDMSQKVGGCRAPFLREEGGWVPI